MQLLNRYKGFMAIGLIPTLIIYLLFVVVPIFWSAYYGFFDWKGIGDATFIGIQNYIEILNDPVFLIALKNNLVIVGASLLGQVPIALLLALVLLKSNWFQRFLRTAVFMPMVISTVVIGLVWQYIYHPQIGILNFFLETIGLGHLSRAWLANPDTAIYYLMIPIIWNYIGLYLIIFISALQNIPGEINDAAKIDGAVGARKIFTITLPMIWNTLKVAIVLCISGSLKAFDHVFIMTGGGPAQATELLATFMYNETFSVYRFGYGSAISTTIIILSLVFILISQILMKKDYQN